MKKLRMVTIEGLIVISDRNSILLISSYIWTEYEEAELQPYLWVVKVCLRSQTMYDNSHMFHAL